MTAGEAAINRVRKWVAVLRYDMTFPAPLATDLRALLAEIERLRARVAKLEGKR